MQERLDRWADEQARKAAEAKAKHDQCKAEWEEVKAEAKTKRDQGRAKREEAKAEALAAKEAREEAYFAELAALKDKGWDWTIEQNLDRGGAGAGTFRGMKFRWQVTRQGVIVRSGYGFTAKDAQRQAISYVGRKAK